MMWLYNSVTKRDPKTRKVVKVVKSFSLKDENIGARLIEAFEKDEEICRNCHQGYAEGKRQGAESEFYVHL